MQAFSIAKLAGFGLAVLVLGSCGVSAPPGGAMNFRSQYATARNALEAGKYGQAQRAYARLLPQAGPLTPRLRLEYAHSYLRAGEYASAASEARAVAVTETGAGRSAALAVIGAAEHEIGLALLSQGKTASGQTHLAAAGAALGELLAEHPELDPLGSLAGRKASIDVRLSGL